MQKETMVEFNISLPRSINEEPQTHQCTVQTQRRPKSHTEQANNTMCPTTASCSISVKTVLGRILPKCNATEGTVWTSWLALQRTDHIVTHFVIVASLNTIAMQTQL